MTLNVPDLELLILAGIIKSDNTMIRYKSLKMRHLGKRALWCIVISVLLQLVRGEISSKANKDNLEATMSSESTSSLLPIASESKQTSLEVSKKEKTLRFVNELKNVTKDAGGFLRLRCAVTGSIPATKIEWFSNEAPLMEGKAYTNCY